MLGSVGDDLLETGEGDTAQAGDDNDRVHVNGAMTTGSLDGGNGIDTLDTGGTGTIGAAVAVSGFERLALDASSVSLTAAQIAGITTLLGAAGATQGALALGTATGASFSVDAGLTALSVTGSQAGMSSPSVPAPAPR